jgi:hypothetical protein
MEINGKTFQKQYRKCSRSCTHGQAGQGHGPYWYKSGSGESLKYVGKELPAEVVKHLDLVKSHKSNLQEMAQELEKAEQKRYAEARHTGELRRAVQSLVNGGSLDKKLLDELGLSDYFVLV